MKDFERFKKMLFAVNIYAQRERNGVLWIVTKKAERDKNLRAITIAQYNANRYYNVAIKPYKGRKYDQLKYESIVIG